MSIINPLSANVFVPAATAHVPQEERQYDLRPHQIVQATVAEGGAERVLLELEHQQFWAQTRVALQAGQRLHLQVLETAPQIRLRIVKDPLVARLRQALHFLGSRWEWSPLLAELAAAGGPLRGSLSPGAQQTLAELSAFLGDSPAEIDGKGLAHLSRRLGLSWEAELSRGEEGATSLKSALLETLARLAGNNDELADRVRQLLQELEMFQLCRARLAQAGAGFVPLPLPFLEQGYLLAEGRRQSGEGEEEGLTVFSLHLKLQGLGNLRVDMLHEPQGLLARFVCDSPEKAAFVASFRERLESVLSFFPLQGVAFASGAEDPGKTLFGRVLPEEGGVLDARV